MSRFSLEDGVQKYDLWMTIPDDFTTNMIAAINAMEFTGDVHQLVCDRINQHLGMPLDSEEHRNARKIWRGTTPLKQADPDADKVGVFRPCLESSDYTKTSCSYVEPSQSYEWAKNWANGAWVSDNNAFPWTGEGYTFDWGKNFEYEGVSANREKPFGSQELVVLGNSGEGPGTEINWETQGQDPVIFFCEACVDASECQNLLAALNVTTKDQCSSPTLHI